MIEYQGKKLTPLEWRLVEYLENEKNRIDNIETEKADVRKFLAKKSLQIETSGYNSVSLFTFFSKNCPVVTQF